MQTEQIVAWPFSVSVFMIVNMWLLLFFFLFFPPIHIRENWFYTWFIGASLKPFYGSWFFGCISQRTQALNLSLRLFLSLCFWGSFCGYGLLCLPKNWGRLPLECASVTDSPRWICFQHILEKLVLTYNEVVFLPCGGPELAPQRQEV